MLRRYRVRTEDPGRYCMPDKPGRSERLLHVECQRWAQEIGAGRNAGVETPDSSQRDPRSELVTCPAETGRALESQRHSRLVQALGGDCGLESAVGGARVYIQR